MEETPRDRNLAVNLDHLHGPPPGGSQGTAEAGAHLCWVDAPRATADRWGRSALLADLKERGLLDETLVVGPGEMGRTSRGNGQWGRDPWGFCFPALLAGGGVRGGSVFGRSDRDAAYPADQPVSPEDLAATVFEALGIDPHGTITDRQDRPVPLVDGGRALCELFG